MVDTDTDTDTDTTTATPIDPEATAARLALEGGFLARATVAVRALARLLRDTNDTRQVFLIGLVVNGPAFPRFLARLGMDENGARLLREQPSIDSAHVDYAALRALPDGTLGREYVRFLDDNGLDPDLFQAPPGLPSMPAFIAKRLRQSHDLWHVLTGYGTNIPSELALLAFTWRVTRMPAAGLIALAGGIKVLFLAPARVVDIVRGARRGRHAAFLPAVVWEDHWTDDLGVLRRELGIAA